MNVLVLYNTNFDYWVFLQVVYAGFFCFIYNIKTSKYGLEQVLQRQFTSFPFSELPISFLYITSAH